MPQSTELDPTAATELRHHLLGASKDLERLQRLVTDASPTQPRHFNDALGIWSAPCC